MAGEWVRSTWDFSPITLSHTGSTIVKAFHSFLTQCGWDLAPFSSLTDERYYLRSDRSTLVITNNAIGAVGSSSKVGTNLAISTVLGSGSTKTAHTLVISPANLPCRDVFTRAGFLQPEPERLLFRLPAGTQPVRPAHVAAAPPRARLTVAA